jgi:hypothetical protein
MGTLLLRRSSLAERATEALRAVIADGSIPDPLPGEHSLARQLGVSRPTVRAAMAVLAREGILRTAQGRRTRLARDAARWRETPPASVCVVSPVSRDILFADQHPVLLQMHARFAASGIGWEEVFDKKLAGAHPEARMRQLVAGRRNTCWIMLASTAAMQEWFARFRLPALVLGSCHGDIALPSIDIDYRALGWHAAGVILQQGHRRLGLLTPARPLAGDEACLQGFCDYASQANLGVVLHRIEIGAESAVLRSKLDRVLKRGDRPTVLFCLLQRHVLTALLHLLERGAAVPREISLVARDLPAIMEQSWPDLAHYSQPTTQLVERALRMAKSLLAGRALAAQSVKIMPDFISGRTLGPAKEP